MAAADISKGSDPVRYQPSFSTQKRHSIIILDIADISLYRNKKRKVDIHVVEIMTIYLTNDGGRK